MLSHDSYANYYSSADSKGVDILVALQAKQLEWGAYAPHMQMIILPLIIRANSVIICRKFGLNNFKNRKLQSHWSVENANSFYLIRNLVSYYQ